MTAAAFSERRSQARAARRATTMRRLSVVVAAAFAVFVILSVSFVHWSVATAPVRAIYGVALLGFLATACRPQLTIALHKQRNTLLLIAGFALLGCIVSALARASPGLIARQLAEIHLQAAVNLIVAAAVLEVCGARTVVRAFIGVIGFSMALAVLQGVNFEPAWAVRDALGPLLDAAAHARGRAAGLSLNSVLLGTQACLAIAMLYMFRVYAAPPGERRADPQLLLLCAAALVVAVASGTRSPMIGILVFLAIYLTRRWGPWALVAGLAVAAAAPAALNVVGELQGAGLRVAQTEDKSAIGRWPLLIYGLRLFFANPFGYGFGFNPTAHWAEHWTALSHLKNAGVIRGLELHNYFLNTLNKYGAGQIFLLALLARLLWRRRTVLLGFAPYIVHIFFHNDGPLDTDYMIWFVIALSSMSFERPGESPRRKSNKTRRAAARLG